MMPIITRRHFLNAKNELTCRCCRGLCRRGRCCGCWRGRRRQGDASLAFIKHHRKTEQMEQATHSDLDRDRNWPEPHNAVNIYSLHCVNCQAKCHVHVGLISSTSATMTNTFFVSKAHNRLHLQFMNPTGSSIMMIRIQAYCYKILNPAFLPIGRSPEPVILWVHI